MVGPTGSVLIRQAGGLAPAAQMREGSTTWRLALALEEDREHQMSGGTIWLHAAARQGRVKVRLAVTAFGD